MAKLSNDTKWMLLSSGSAVGAAVLTHLLARGGWRLARGNKAPRNPDAPEVSWPDALAWGAGVGLAVGVARTLAMRAAASAWKREKGFGPPLRR